MTRLGNDKQLRKSGRYARVMGTLWRHRKREKCGRAAMGLLLDIWSRCADQSEDFVSEKQMRQLINGDPNGRRQLKELIAAGFVDQVEGGYVPHDWEEHSGFGGSSDARATGDATRDETGLATEDVTRDVMNATAEIIQESIFPRACASPKSPSLQVSKEEKLLNAGAGGHEAPSAGPPPTDGSLALAAVPEFVPHPDSVWGTTELVRTRYAARLKAANGATATWPGHNVRALGVFVGWLRALDGNESKLLDRTLDGFFADERARLAGFPIAYLAGSPDAYLNPPKARAAPPRQARGRMQMAPATTDADFADAEPFEQQLAKLRGNR